MTPAGGGSCVPALENSPLTWRLALQSALPTIIGFSKCAVGAMQAEASGDRMWLDGAYLQACGEPEVQAQLPGASLLIVQDNNPIFLASCNWGWRKINSSRDQMPSCKMYNFRVFVLFGFFFFFCCCFQGQAWSQADMRL